MRSSPIRNGYNSPQQLDPSRSGSPRLRLQNSSPSGRSLKRSRADFQNDSFITNESPSRQLLDEYTRYQRESDRSFRARLDAAAEELARKHKAALKFAKEEHEKVLRGAEKAHEILSLQIENEKLRRIREQQENEQRIREENARLAREVQMDEYNRQQELQRQRHEDERQKIELQARIEEQERLHKLELEQKEEQARTAREKSLAQDKAAAEAAQKAKATEQANQTQVPTFAPTTTQNAPSKASIPSVQSSPLMDWNAIEQEHNDYLTLHKKLKGLRKHMVKIYKQGNETAKRTGQQNPLGEMQDLRRALAKAIGQLTMDKNKNKIIRIDIREIMLKAWRNTAVPVEAKTFIIKPTTPFSEEQNTQVSGLFVFLLNILIKSAVRVMPNSATTTTYNALDPIGVLLCWIVSLAEFQLHGNPFADVFLAKYHKAAPILFGIYGPENTTSGRERLGWAREDGDWADIQTHLDTLNGLSIGYAALTLRDFSRVKDKNAFPHWMYWKSLAGILNVPTDQLTRSHGIALRGLLNLYADKFAKSYRGYAMLALRKALVDIPNQAPKSADMSILSVVRDNLQTKHGLRL